MPKIVFFFWLLDEAQRRAKVLLNASLYNFIEISKKKKKNTQQKALNQRRKIRKNRLLGGRGKGLSENIIG